MAGLVDLKLDPITNDLVIENSDLQIVKDLDWLVQSIKIKLQFFKKEWVLDTEYGLDYYGLVFIKGPNLNLIDNLIKMAILEYEEVNEILSFESSFNKAGRSLSVEFIADSIFGELNETVTI
ncbi:MAG: hypothetical protein V3V00_15960 [Saprospiraceae bacterium]